ncbi:MAG: family 2 glycosyl transferase [Polyangiaceae bacterium]|jgi:dolichol-phosphate mannosyltransferase|nr:family 2 glycosyl transferase [Polyangiaceae bacterium]
MSDLQQLFVVVPVFNEAANMDRLFDACSDIHRELGARHAVRFVLVDDGSTDGTSEAAKQAAGGLPLEVLRLSVNQGPGRAFAAAFRHLAPQLRETDWVVTIEGDNTSRLELLQQMMTRAAEGFDVVLASPYLYGGGISNTNAYRVFLSHVANVFVKEGLGLHGIVTMSSFFRLYRGSAFMRLQAAFGPEIIDRSGFESMIELLLKIVYLRMSVSEVAMKLDTSRRAGKSKMKVARTALGYLTLWREKALWRRSAEGFDAFRRV